MERTGIIGKVLDAGASGVIIPMTNGVEEAKQAVAACRYFPGQPDFGPTRPRYNAGTGHLGGANGRFRASPMIETRQAGGLERIDEILASCRG
ncbi:MAG: hypothetical protein IPI33_15165 [Dehalococcoidia bacterium]|nr:hypothetical protein [Dehalococcoidia bacterium]